jgi:hypothetical protein
LRREPRKADAIHIRVVNRCAAATGLRPKCVWRALLMARDRAAHVRVTPSCSKDGADLRECSAAAAAHSDVCTADARDACRAPLARAAALGRKREDRVPSRAGASHSHGSRLIPPRRQDGSPSSPPVQLPQIGSHAKDRRCGGKISRAPTALYFEGPSTVHRSIHLGSADTKHSQRKHRCWVGIM